MIYIRTKPNAFYHYNHYNLYICYQLQINLSKSVLKMLKFVTSYNKKLMNI